MQGREGSTGVVPLSRRRKPRNTSANFCSAAAIRLRARACFSSASVYLRFSISLDLNCCLIRIRMMRLFRKITPLLLRPLT